MLHLENQMFELYSDLQVHVVYLLYIVHREWEDHLSKDNRNSYIPTWIPSPLSWICICFNPPLFNVTTIEVACASMLFSIISFNADPGLWTTSPAAILLTTSSGKRWICLLQDESPSYVFTLPAFIINYITNNKIEINKKKSKIKVSFV